MKKNEKVASKEVKEAVNNNEIIKPRYDNYVSFINEKENER